MAPGGRAMAGSERLRSYWRCSAAFSSARRSCQKPSAIIVATAAATRMVGTGGKRIRRPRSGPRGRGACIRGRAEAPWPAEAGPPPAAAVSGSQSRMCTQNGGSADSSRATARAVTIAPDDQDQKGGGTVADVEAGEIQPAGPAFGREARQPLVQGLRGAARAQAAQGDFGGGRLLHASVLRYAASTSLSGYPG